MTEVKAEDIKKMSMSEFVKLGILQEINRRFLHPMGLAMSVVIDKDTDMCAFDSIWDYREDPEGIVFADDIAKDSTFDSKAQIVEDLLESKKEAREKAFGWHIQPTK